MNREKRGPLGRVAASTLAALAMLVGVFAIIGSVAAPAQAAGEKYGYSKVVSEEAYLKYYLARNVQVLHVDTEHTDPDGFWFAAKSAFQARGFGWIYQPYGMWCDSAASEVVFNPWMNIHWCGVNPDKMRAAAGPYWEQNTAVCRQSTGLPWKTGSMFQGQTACADTMLDWNSNPLLQEPSRESTCAPWEPQGLDAAGAPECAKVRYGWENDAPNSFWMPAPDACTGMPANTNKTATSPNPASFVPVSGDGSCTGNAFAPNCEAGSTTQACTGVAETVGEWASVSITASATDVTASATVSKTATASAVRARVTKTASKWFKGKQYKASATVKIVKKRSATESATVTATGTASRTATMSCSAPTADEARACAEEKAQDEANRLAYDAALADAKAEAGARATTQAKAAATTAAAAAASQAVVTAADKEAAATKATKRATKRVNRMIANAR